MSTDLTDPRTPDDPEAAFLAALDAAVSGWPVRDGSDLLATATRVRDLAASDPDPAAHLDPARRQEIWSTIVANRPAPSTTRATNAAIARPTDAPVALPARHWTLGLSRRGAHRLPDHRSWRPGGWLATAVAICLVALLAFPLVRELGSNGGHAPAQLPAQTRSGAMLGAAADVAGAPTNVTNAMAGSGGDNAAGATQAPNVTAPTQAAPPADGGILAPPSTVISTMSPNLTVAERVSVADPHQLLFQLEQNGYSYNWEDRRRTDPSGKSPYDAISWTPGDTDLKGSWGGVEIVQTGQADEPLAGYIVFDGPEKASQRLREIEQTPGLVTQKTRIDQSDGVIVFNNDRVVTIVQVGNVLVLGTAWTGDNDWMSSVIDLQTFKWQSLRQTVSAVAYLDHVVTAYQGHR